MANAEQLAIVRQGVAVWNAWRKEHLRIEIDLRGADLTGADLTGADLTGADLTGANLVSASLRRANLPDAIFQGAYLWSASLEGANLFSAYFQRTDLRRASLQGAYLFGTQLNEATLSGANLRETILSLANLERADLTGANLHGANLRETILRKADLTGADLTGADLRGASLQGTNLADARVGVTVFSDLDLSTVRELDMLRHTFSSTIGIDTIYRSEGNIPEPFLKDAGVPDTRIDYMRSLTVRPSGYYSVCISYSRHDKAVAQRLHADLQAAGVRCWFAPHDLAISTPIAGSIDAAIRISDKLLIILSEASVKSHWVAFEVSTALYHEVEQGRTLLFPIRLDDAVLSMPNGWAAQLHTRHIGDFRAWKDHDRYQAAFTRLLRDLTAKDQAGT